MDFFLQLNVLQFISTLTKGYLIFYLVNAMFKSDINAFRLVLSGLILGLLDTVKPYLLEPTVSFVLIGNVIAILVAKKEFTFLTFLRFSLLYFIVTLLSKGMELLLLDILSPNETLTSMLVCLSILVIALFLKIITTLSRDKRKHKTVYNVDLLYGNKVFKTKALYDSGNLLYYKGAPVTVVSKKAEKRLELQPNIDITVQTLGGISVLKGGKMRVMIYLDKKTHKVLPITYAISSKMGNRGYEVILHSETEVV